jgi:hypothetical protein
MFHLSLLKNPSEGLPKWGASSAQSDITQVKAALGTTATAGGVVLDFAGITAANASYVRASVAWLIRCGMAHHSNTSNYHVSSDDPWGVKPADIGGVFLANVAAEVREEVDSVLSQPGYRLACFEIVEWKPPAIVSRTRILGHLDEQLRQCLFKLYAIGGSGTAADLHARYADEGVQITAWNNRLAGLYERLLLRRKKSGRNFIYHTLSKELDQYGLSLSAA